MKVIIAGGRTASRGSVSEAIASARRTGFFGGQQPSEVVCGGAKGADEYGRLWAVAMGIEVKMFLPDWDGLGKKALRT